MNSDYRAYLHGIEEPSSVKPGSYTSARVIRVSAFIQQLKLQHMNKRLIELHEEAITTLHSIEILANWKPDYPGRQESVDKLTELHRNIIRQINNLVIHGK